MKHFLQKFLLLLTTLFTVTFTYAQFDIPKKPGGSAQTSVYDYSGLLAPEEKSALENKLIHYADTTSTQIVVVIVPTIKGENIGTLTPQWAHKWGIGQKGKDNGVFILLAEKEREIWIAPGYGLEPILTAGVNGEIVRNEIIPYFKQGDYYGGLDSGSDALIELFSGTYKNDRKSSDGGSGVPVLLIIAGVVLFLIIASKMRGGKNGGNRGMRGPDLGDIIILSRMGRNRSGGFGGGSFGGGGFGGGFGGGGFSGGGAGGSW